MRALRKNLRHSYTLREKCFLRSNGEDTRRRKIVPKRFRLGQRERTRTKRRLARSSPRFKLQFRPDSAKAGRGVSLARKRSALPEIDLKRARGLAEISLVHLSYNVCSRPRDALGPCPRCFARLTFDARPTKFGKWRLMGLHVIHRRVLAAGIATDFGNCMANCRKVDPECVFNERTIFWTAFMTEVLLKGRSHAWIMHLDDALLEIFILIYLRVDKCDTAIGELIKYKIAYSE